MKTIRETIIEKRLELAALRKLYGGWQNLQYRRESQRLLAQIRELRELEKEGFEFVGESGVALGDARPEDVEEHVDGDVFDQLRQTADEQDRVWFDRFEE